jgi:hypothetical protein
VCECFGLESSGDESVGVSENDVSLTEQDWMVRISRDGETTRRVEKKSGWGGGGGRDI